jgi:hypothetical protein
MMTGECVLAWRADHACIEDLEDVDIIDDAGEGTGLGCTGVDITWYGSRWCMGMGGAGDRRKSNAR